ncbi:MAG: HAD-IA family hydrolase [Deltaproteobacteria bacterium]|nr:HAD-IA family hydrolase [Deltaproteobacteria bacterium]
MGAQMTWSRVKVVIFDCDGVMFDSREANEAYYNSILARFGKSRMNAEQRAYVHTHTASQSVAYLFDGDPRAAEAEAFRQRMSYDPFIGRMKMEPHLRGFLEYLRPTYKRAVATNRSDTMGRVLEEHGLTDCFELIVSSLDVARPKPAADALLKVLGHFNVSASEAVYIGDSDIDAMTAAAAHVPFVAYKNPALSADLHITYFKEMEAYL